MNHKIVVILEVILAFILMVLYLVFKVIPDFRKDFGSSDSFASKDSYQNMFEITSSNFNFAYLIDKDSKIYHLFFFDKNSLCLYNQNIENSTINDGIDESIKLLIKNGLLTNKSNIVITKYGNESYLLFINSFQDILKKYNLDINISYKSNTLEEKSLELNGEVSGSGDNPLLFIDLYSKNITGLMNKSSESTRVGFSEEYSKKMSDKIYLNLEDYIIDNNIKDMDKNNTSLDIALLPGDSSGNYYPSGNSWYFVKNSKIYAYIEFKSGKEVYGYCYNGSIDMNKKGMC